MSDFGLLEEFLRSKSNGTGLSRRYPKLAAALETMMSLLPEGMSTLTEEDLARLPAKALEKGISLHDLSSALVEDGPVKVIAEKARDKIIEDRFGTPALVVVKEMIEAGSGILDKAKDIMIVPVSVAVTLGVYELTRKAEEAEFKKDLDWHTRNGVEIKPGSELHKYVHGEPAEKARIYNPFAPARAARPVVKVHNPFGALEAENNAEAVRAPLAVDNPFPNEEQPEDDPERPAV